VLAQQSRNRDVIWAADVTACYQRAVNGQQRDQGKRKVWVVAASFERAWTAARQRGEASLPGIAGPMEMGSRQPSVDQTPARLNFLQFQYQELRKHRKGRARFFYASQLHNNAQISSNSLVLPKRPVEGSSALTTSLPNLEKVQLAFVSCLDFATRLTWIPRSRFAIFIRFLPV
jgi:hypothetical protein